MGYTYVDVDTLTLKYEEIPVEFAIFINLFIGSKGDICKDLPNITYITQSLISAFNFIGLLKLQYSFLEYYHFFIFSHQLNPLNKTIEYIKQLKPNKRLNSTFTSKQILKANLMVNKGDGILLIELFLECFYSLYCAQCKPFSPAPSFSTSRHESWKAIELMLTASYPLLMKYILEYMNKDSYVKSIAGRKSRGEIARIKKECSNYIEQTLNERMIAYKNKCSGILDLDSHVKNIISKNFLKAALIKEVEFYNECYPDNKKPSMDAKRFIKDYNVKSWLINNLGTYIKIPDDITRIRLLKS